MAMIRNDFKPQVVSFDETLQGINLMVQKDLLWPCYMFQVSLEMPIDSDLNPIELLVLRLAAQKYREVDKIHEISCLDKDLIRFIKDRLVQLGLLESDGELSDSGKGKVSNVNNKRDGTDNDNGASKPLVMAQVYVDQVTGQLLHCITKEFTTETIVPHSSGKGWALKVGSAGQAKEIKVHLITPKNKAEVTIPSENDVLSVIRKMHRKQKRQQFLSVNKQDKRLFAPKNTRIKVESEWQEVFLHTKLFLQKNTDEFVVTDGFGLGFSPVFSNAIHNLEADWLTHIKEQAIKVGIDNKVRAENLFDIDGVKKLYPRLGTVIEKAESGYHGFMSASEADKSRHIKIFVMNIFSAYEHALKIVWEMYQIENWQSYFQGATSTDLQLQLINCVEKLKFNIKPHLEHALNFSPAQLKRNADGGSIEFQGLLALNLVSALNQPDHPLRHLQNYSSHGLNRISDLKSGRGSTAHGGDVYLNIEQIQKLRAQSYQALGVLIPNITSFLPLESVKNIQLPNSGQSIIMASIAVDKAFDLFIRQQMSTEFKNQLIESEQFFHELDTSLQSSIDATSWILAIGSLLQSLFHNIQSEQQVNFKREELRKEALLCAKHAGFDLDGGKLPGSLNTVNSKRIDRACCGLTSTLGAEALAWLLTQEAMMLNQLSSDMPELLSFIDDVTELRGHGNEPCTLTLERLIEVKDKTYKIIRLMLQA